MYLLFNVLSIAITSPYDNAFIIFGKGRSDIDFKCTSMFKGYFYMINYIIELWRVISNNLTF